ncbi:MAG: hypothetical protein LBR26_17340 [Prevotella sp.]|nr:hypothetical protein [Prevotella sp.]
MQKFGGQGEPLFPVDCKKDELTCDFKNAGRKWTEAKHPSKVSVWHEK